MDNTKQVSDCDTTVKHSIKMTTLRLGFMHPWK
jgi:hypothetical protein